MNLTSKQLERNDVPLPAGHAQVGSYICSLPSDWRSQLPVGLSFINPVKDIWLIILDVFSILGMIYIIVYREELTDKSRLRRFDKFKVICKLI